MSKQAENLTVWEMLEQLETMEQELEETYGSQGCRKVTAWFRREAGNWRNLVVSEHNVTETEGVDADVIPSESLRSEWDKLVRYSELLSMLFVRPSPQPKG